MIFFALYFVLFGVSITLSASYAPYLVAPIFIAYIVSTLIICYFAINGPWYERILIILSLPFAFMALFG